MKKLVCLIIALTMFFSTIALAEEKQEYRFRDIPWGADFDSVKDALSDYDLHGIVGATTDVHSVEDVIYNESVHQMSFEYKDINITAFAMNSAQRVAGYTTTAIKLYFAYLPVNGILTHCGVDSALYGATYEFEPASMVTMVMDLRDKLVSLYGQYDSGVMEKNEFGEAFTLFTWNGENDSMIVLGSKIPSSADKFSDITVWISYIWAKGDDLLNNASDAERNAARAAERSVSGNGDTSGL